MENIEITVKYQIDDEPATTVIIKSESVNADLPFVCDKFFSALKAIGYFPEDLEQEVKRYFQEK